MMIVRTLVNCDISTVFNKKAKILVHPSDGVGHMLFETTLSTEKTHRIESSYLTSFGTQAYYCIDGQGVVTFGQTDHALKPGTVIAANTREGVSITPTSKMRMAVIFRVETPEADVVVRNLDEIYGTERDVYWGNGRSRRLLIRGDKMGFALCITQGNSHTDSLIQYRNHFESCYYISGSGEYEWVDGKHPIQTEQGQATVFIMDKHDTHHMRIREESICLSIFTPPIEGTERHDFSNGRASSY